ncbi:hypothetical protein GYH30_014275 [Glycine max]|nr:hypothetical protein GYH30_014275 [Glycine max]
MAAVCIWLLGGSVPSFWDRSVTRDAVHYLSVTFVQLLCVWCQLDFRIGILNS